MTEEFSTGCLYNYERSQSSGYYSYVVNGKSVDSHTYITVLEQYIVNLEIQTTRLKTDLLAKQLEIKNKCRHCTHKKASEIERRHLKYIKESEG